MPNHKDNSNSLDFYNGIILGSLIGASAYYLFKTEDGQKTKEDIIQKSQSSLEKLLKVVDEIKEEIKQEETKNQIPVYKASKKKTPPPVKISKKTIKPKPAKIKAAQKADLMQKQLEQSAKNIERKFFVKKGKKLK